MEYEPLSAEERSVFEWIGKHVEARVCFWFGEVMSDCGIGTAHELHTILVTLEQYPTRVGSHIAIIKAIYPEEEHGEGAFEVSSHAGRAWAEYCAWEREHLCPRCARPLLKRVTVLRCQDPDCRHEHDWQAMP